MKKRRTSAGAVAVAAPAAAAPPRPRYFAAGGGARRCQLGAPDVGTTVAITADFFELFGGNRLLKKGMRGKVVNSNAQGDVCVVFDGSEARRWVAASHCHANLTVVAPAVLSVRVALLLGQGTVDKLPVKGRESCVAALPAGLRAAARRAGHVASDVALLGYLRKAGVDVTPVEPGNCGAAMLRLFDVCLLVANNALDAGIDRTFRRARAIDARPSVPSMEWERWIRRKWDYLSALRGAGIPTAPTRWGDGAALRDEGARLQFAAEVVSQGWGDVVLKPVPGAYGERLRLVPAGTGAAAAAAEVKRALSSAAAFAHDGHHGVLAQKRVRGFADGELSVYYDMTVSPPAALWARRDRAPAGTRGVLHDDDEMEKEAVPLEDVDDDGMPSLFQGGGLRRKQPRWRRLADDVARRVGAPAVASCGAALAVPMMRVDLARGDVSATPAQEAEEWFVNELESTACGWGADVGHDDVVPLVGAACRRALLRWQHRAK